MEAEAILRIRPALTHYLHQYDDCFGRCTARRHHPNGTARIRLAQ